MHSSVHAPCVHPCVQDRRTVVTPVIDTIDYHDMTYASWTQRIPSVGTFDWYVNS